MKVEIRGYTPGDKAGVTACLKRNYPWMRNLSDDAVYAWARPMLEYRWREPLPEKVKPYQYGLVLLAEGQVVGYLGFIFSVRTYEGKDYVYQTGTTWAIDDGYRIYMFKALKLAYSLADLLGDFTPIKPVEQSLTKVFKFRYMDQASYQFSFVSPFGSSHLRFHPITRAEELDDPVLRGELKDHEPYGARCVEISDPQTKEMGYLFYRVIQRKHQRRFFNKRRSLLRVLKMTNPRLFGTHVEEIIRYLQKDGWPVVECDARFMDGKAPVGHGIKKKRAARLAKGALAEDAPVDFLYSEEAMMD